MVSGRLPHRIKDFHQRYGSCVRVGPNELSFTSAAAWRDIYPPNFVRPYEYKDKPPGKDAENLISASEPDHARFRKVLSPAFSDRSTRDQEPIVRRYVDLMIRKLRRQLDDQDGGDGRSSESQEADVLTWYNYTTFDIIGEVMWGLPFGCLDNLVSNPWIQVIERFKEALIAGAFKFYPPLDTVLTALTPKSALANLSKIWKTTEDNVTRRLRSDKEHRKDVISHIVAANESASDLFMSRNEIEINAILMVIAGSESVTTALTGTTNYLARNAATFQALAQEIRSTFDAEEQITGASLVHLPYLNAVIHEGLRLCPTLPDGLRREVPKLGAIIAGIPVPGGTVVSIPQWASYQSSGNFHSPESFMPERWLVESPESEYKGIHRQDRKDAFNPFSLGPHNCLGRNLAYLELRLILAKMVWNFDIGPPRTGKLPQWAEQDIYWFWDKQPTRVSLRKV